MYPSGGTKEDPLNLNAVISGDESVSAVEPKTEDSKPIEVGFPSSLVGLRLGMRRLGEVTLMLTHNRLTRLLVPSHCWTH